MVQIRNLNTINIEGFKVLPIDGYYDLTTARSIYQCSPTDGGIKIVPTLAIENISSGYFYITQICTKHILKILTENNNECLFDNKGEIFRDTPSPARCHFAYYKITNNTIVNLANSSNQVVFFDAPFKELFSWWTEIEFVIEFETWFQYSNSIELNTDIKPILKLNWELECKAMKQDNEWMVAHSNYSSVESINSSIEYFNSNDNARLPLDLRHLGTTVHEFSLLHDELDRNYRS
jgi:hypothetical protein